MCATEQHDVVSRKLKKKKSIQEKKGGTKERKKKGIIVVLVGVDWRRGRKRSQDTHRALLSVIVVGVFRLLGFFFSFLICAALVPVPLFLSLLLCLCLSLFACQVDGRRNSFFLSPSCCPLVLWSHSVPSLRVSLSLFPLSLSSTTERQRATTGWLIGWFID